MDHVPIEHAYPNSASTVDRHRYPGLGGARSRMEPVFADQPKCHAAALEQVVAVLHDGIEHGLRVGHRAADHAKDLSRCRLLGARVGELLLELGDVVLPGRDRLPPRPRRELAPALAACRHSSPPSEEA